MSKKSFYCKGKLTIDEWNDRFNEAIRLEMPESEMEIFLEERPCQAQCTDCACIVGARRIETRELIKRMNNG